MKTLILLLLLPLCAAGQYRDQDPQVQALTFAPSNYDQLRNSNIYYSSWSSKNPVKENSVHTATIYLNSKRGKRKEIDVKTFDDKGRMVQRKALRETITVKGKKQSKTTYQYDEQYRMIGLQRFKNGKLVSRYRFEYFDGLKRSLVEQTTFKQKTTIYTLKTTYDELLKKPTSV